MKKTTLLLYCNEEDYFVKLYIRQLIFQIKIQTTIWEKVQYNEDN